MSSQPVRSPEPFLFGDDFELSLQARELRRSGRVLKLERIPTEILFLLVEQRGTVVTRQQIVERIWGAEAFLDTDNAINTAIRKIRQVLRDNPEQPQYIQTITGKGYRFIPPLAAGATLKAHPALQPVAPVIVLPLAPAARRRSMFVAAIFLLLLIGVAAMTFLLRRSRRPAAEQARTGRILLAVLPFDNLTGDASQDYFSDGLTEEMITHIGRLDPARVAVIARTSVMVYKSRRETLARIGTELGVQYVLEGSVRRDSGNVRITAQLIQIRDQTHLWTREYDRELKDVLAMQDEIAQEIGDEISTTLGEAKPKRGPVRAPLSTQQYQAYDSYLKGEYFLSKRSAGDLRRAIAYFQQATAADPNYARAYAGLADGYALLGGYSGLAQEEFTTHARSAALRALEIDDHLPDAHAALALIIQNHDWDWQAAEKEFRRAIELDPNYATAHHWYAEQLMWRGRFEEALQESRVASQLDPLSLIIASDQGAILFYARRYDDAIRQFRRVLDMDPHFPRAQLIVSAYVQRGMFAEALAAMERERPPVDTPWYLSELAFVQGAAGHRREARSAFHRLRALGLRQQFDPILMVPGYLAVADKESALTCLQNAYAKHSGNLTALKIDPIYDSLRADPRFRDLLQRVGLEE
jgi:TolB-like protein/DNA-binding winged helix-turn-helix (wHTH) protein/Tfp pilus assembly protein PilF